MGLNKELYYGGIKLSDYGCYISGDSVYNAPVRVYDEYEIPGRNGNLLISQNRFANIEVTYPAFIFAGTQAEFADKMQQLRNALYSLKGYQTITDDYHPDEFRKGVYMAGLEAAPVQYNRAGEFEITFDCKPQRFLTSGQTQTTLTANTNVTVSNPTAFDSCPSFELSSGTNGGKITINGVDITIAATGSSATVYLDTETGEAYSSTGANLNQYISIPGNEFPKLAPGNNTVKYTRSSGTATCKIKPNYWRV